MQKLVANKDAVGIFGFSFLEENIDKLKGAMIDGVSPDFETIASSKFPASRPLFIYVKKAHVGVIPGIRNSSPNTPVRRRWARKVISPTRD